MRRMRRILPALLAAMIAVVGIALADDDEAERALREARLDERMQQAFGEDWRERVAVWEDYDLGWACEDGALFAITVDDGINALHVVTFAGGTITSHIENPRAVRQDALPSFAFEIEDEMGLVYDAPSADAQTFARDRDGRWRLCFYRAVDGDGNMLDVDVRDGALSWRIERADGGETAGGAWAAWPPFALDIAEVDVEALPRDERSLRVAMGE